MAQTSTPPLTADRGTYADVRQYLEELDRRGLLIKVDRLTNKDTEIMPIVRWQFRGLYESQRKGWLFENVTDARGRSFDGSVAVAVMGASPDVYAAAMGLDSPEGIGRKWAQVQAAPLDPVQVDPAAALPNLGYSESVDVQTFLTGRCTYSRCALFLRELPTCRPGICVGQMQEHPALPP